MSQKLNELLQQYVNEPYEKLLSLARGGLSVVIPELDKIAKDGKGASLLAPMINVMLAVDNKFNDKELKFINDLLGTNYSFDQIKKLLSDYTGEDWANAIDQFIDSLSEKLKAQILTLLTCFAAVDERISVEETRFIIKLVSKE